MSAPDDYNLNQTLASFMAGDSPAGRVLFIKAKKFILALIRARASDLRNDHGDILDEVFILMMEAPTRYDPQRGSARSFITTVLVPEAIRRVRAKSARPGSKTRREAVKNIMGPTFPMPDPLPNPEAIPSAGYGSPQAIEAACDAHAILMRATPPMRLIVGGLMDGKTQLEIGGELKMDRFRVARRIAGLQRQFAAVA